MYVCLSRAEGEGEGGHLRPCAGERTRSRALGEYLTENKDLQNLKSSEKSTVPCRLNYIVGENFLGTMI